MDPEDFRKWGKVMVDTVADYWLNIRERRPLPHVSPGFMRSMLPDSAPETAEKWEDIMADVEPCILQTVTHWHHPNFFSYYPTGVSPGALIGEILSGGLGCIGFTWLSSPACTELELIVVDWLAKMLKLPKFFLNSHPGPGLGMIQSTASDCTLIALLAAKDRAVKRCTTPDERAKDKTRFIAYTSDQAHSSVERAALLASVKIRLVKHDDSLALRGAALAKAVAEDVANGLTPIYVCATVGTTNTCAIDVLSEIGPICQQYKMWLHIDAAYAGTACVCEEYRHFIDGVEYADSFSLNAHKLMAVNFDCAIMWLKDGRPVKEAFVVDPVYLKHKHEETTTDLRHYQIPLGRRFRSLKVWFVLRSMGVEGLKEHIRHLSRLGKRLHELICKDDRYEIAAIQRLGVVCFKLKQGDRYSKMLLDELNHDGRIHMMPISIHNEIILRLSIVPTLAKMEDIEFAFKVIQEVTDQVLNQANNHNHV